MCSRQEVMLLTLMWDNVNQIEHVVLDVTPAIGARRNLHTFLSYSSKAAGGMDMMHTLTSMQQKLV
jgi:hypothetical protein